MQVPAVFYSGSSKLPLSSACGCSHVGTTKLLSMLNYNINYIIPHLTSPHLTSYLPEGCVVAAVVTALRCLCRSFAELPFYNQGIPVLRSHLKSGKDAQETA